MDTKNDTKAKVVTSIDINLQWPEVSKRTWIEESVEEHFQCVLCGGKLEFRHKTNFVEQAVKEEAHCPQCGVRNRVTDYQLQ